jgi:hypothetical protein
VISALPQFWLHYANRDVVKTREEAAKYQVEAPFYRMHYDFVLKPAQA